MHTRSLLVSATLLSTTVAQIPGLLPPGQLTSEESSATLSLFTPSVSLSAGLSALPALQLTTLLTSVHPDASVNGGPQSITDLETFPIILPDSFTTSNYDSVTRYIFPDIASSAENSVTRWILPDGDSSSYDSVTRYIQPVTAEPESVTNLETFPWIVPDSTATAAASLTAIGTSLPFPVMTGTQIQTVQSAPSWITVNTIPEQSPFVTQRLQTSQTVTNLETFPSIIPDETISPTASIGLSNLPINSSLGLGMTFTPIVIRLSTLGSPIFSTAFSTMGSPYYPTAALPSSTGFSRIGTLSIASLTPVSAASVGASAIATPSPPLGGPFCQYYAPQCPLCDGATVLDGNGSYWQVFCDAMVVTPKNYMQVGNSSAASCLTACNKFSGCSAASISRTNNCLLGIGTPHYLSHQQGEVGFLRVVRGVEASSMSGSVTVSAVSLTIPTSAPITRTSLAVATQPPNLAGCTLTDINCPRCNLVDITDSYGQAFRILCDAYLISSQYSDISTTVLDDCLNSCNDGSCIGVSYDDGKCHIARGRLIGSEPTDGSFAFVPLRSSSGNASSSANLSSSALVSSVRSGQAAGQSTLNPVLLTPSAFPTGAFTIETWRTGTSTAPATSTATACNTSLDTICATCQDLIDDNGVQYRVSCGWGTECQSATPVNTTSVEECMLACDQAPDCQGGYFPDQVTNECNLCPQFIGADRPRTGPPTVAFLRPGTAESSSTALGSGASRIATVPTEMSILTATGSSLVTKPLTLTTITDRASWTVSSTATGSAQASSVSSDSATTVSCPASNGKEYALGDIQTPFTIFCDVAVYAQPYTIFPVDSLLECARDCDVGCSAFEYVNGICQLFDGIYDVVAVKGAIVGYAFDFSDGAAGLEIFTVPGPVIASPFPTQSVASGVV